MLAPRDPVGPGQHDLDHRHPTAAFPNRFGHGDDRSDGEGVRGARVGPPLPSKLGDGCPSRDPWQDNAAAKSPLRSPGRRRGEEPGNLPERADLDAGKRGPGGSQGSEGGILDLIVFGAVNDSAETLSDHRLGGGDGPLTIGRIAPAGSDPQRNRRLVGRDSDERLASPADEVGEHRFDGALAGAEAFDPPEADRPGAGEHGENRRPDRRLPHRAHLARHAREGKHPRVPRRRRPGEIEIDARRCPFGIGDDPAPAGKERLPPVRLRARDGAAGKPSLDVG